MEFSLHRHQIPYSSMPMIPLVNVDDLEGINQNSLLNNYEMQTESKSDLIQKDKDKLETIESSKQFIYKMPEASFQPEKNKNIYQIGEESPRILRTPVKISKVAQKIIKSPLIKKELLNENIESSNSDNNNSLNLKDENNINNFVNGTAHEDKILLNSEKSNNIENLNLNLNLNNKEIINNKIVESIDSIDQLRNDDENNFQRLKLKNEEDFKKFKNISPKSFNENTDNLKERSEINEENIMNIIFENRIENENYNIKQKNKKESFSKNSNPNNLQFDEKYYNLIENSINKESSDRIQSSNNSQRDSLKSKSRSSFKQINKRNEDNVSIKYNETQQINTLVVPNKKEERKSTFASFNNQEAKEFQNVKNIKNSDRIANSKNKFLNEENSQKNTNANIIKESMCYYSGKGSEKDRKMFSPILCTNSERLAKKSGSSVARLLSKKPIKLNLDILNMDFRPKLSNSPIHLKRNYSFNFEKLFDEAKHIQESRQIMKQKYDQIKNEKEISECTFHPKIISNFDNDETISTRAHKWKERRDQRIKEMQSTKNSIENKNCTFHPNIIHDNFSSVFSNETKINQIKLVDKFLERAQIARTNKAYAYNKIRKIYGSGRFWKNTVTIPSEPNVLKHRQNQNQKIKISGHQDIKDMFINKYSLNINKIEEYQTNIEYYHNNDQNNLNNNFIPKFLHKEIQDLVITSKNFEDSSSGSDNS